VEIFILLGVRSDEDEIESVAHDESTSKGSEPDEGSDGLVGSLHLLVHGTGGGTDFEGVAGFGAHVFDSVSGVEDSFVIGTDAQSTSVGTVKGTHGGGGQNLGVVSHEFFDRVGISGKSVGGIRTEGKGVAEVTTLEDADPGTRSDSWGWALGWIDAWSTEHFDGHVNHVGGKFDSSPRTILLVFLGGTTVSVRVGLVFGSGGGWKSGRALGFSGNGASGKLPSGNWAHFGDVGSLGWFKGGTRGGAFALRTGDLWGSTDTGGGSAGHESWFGSSDAEHFTSPVVGGLWSVSWDGTGGQVSRGTSGSTLVVFTGSRVSLVISWPVVDIQFLHSGVWAQGGLSDHLDFDDTSIGSVFVEVRVGWGHGGVEIGHGGTFSIAILVDAPDGDDDQEAQGCKGSPEKVL